MMFPVTEKDMYETQDTVVVRMLQTEDNYTLEDAVRTWYSSRTKRAIQKKLKQPQISGAQCWDELHRELAHHISWLDGVYMYGDPVMTWEEFVQSEKQSGQSDWIK